MKKIVTLILVALLFGNTINAVNIPAGTKLYLKVNENWKEANARFAAYFYGTGNDWSNFTPVSGETDTYETVTPSGVWTNVIFCRMNPSAPANNWDNKWSQTGNLTYNGTDNCYTLPAGAWEGTGDDNWSLFGGSVTPGDAITVNLKKTDWTGVVSIYYWGAGSATVPMTPDGDWYSYTFPTSVKSVNIIFINGTGWSTNPNQTVNIENVTQSTCYELGGASGDGKRLCNSVTCPVIEEPSVYLSLPAKIFIDGQIVLNATSLNVTDPVYTYTVKVPGASNFQPASSPYQPTVIGLHTFKVQVAESAAPGTVLAERIVDVTVASIPDPIVIGVKLPDGWTNVSLWNWGPGIDANFKTTTLIDGWYKCTFTYTESINFTFVDSEGINWPTDVDDAVKRGRQTVNVENVIQSTCYETGDQAWPETGDWGKRTVTSVNCGTVGVTQPKEDAGSIIGGTGKINAFFDGLATVQLYSVNGKLLNKGTTENFFEQTGLIPGLYIIKINGQASKVLVK